MLKKTINLRAISLIASSLSWLSLISECIKPQTLSPLYICRYELHSQGLLGKILTSGAWGESFTSSHCYIWWILTPDVNASSWQSVVPFVPARISIWWPSGWVLWRKNLSSTVKAATRSSASSLVQSLHLQLTATSSPRASWRTPSKSPMNLQLGCMPTCTRLWITSTRYGDTPYESLASFRR